MKNGVRSGGLRLACLKLRIEEGFKSDSFTYDDSL